MQDLIEEANKTYLENFNKDIDFKRAIFLSWYCSVGDCTFCFMSTQKNIIKNPKLAKRSKESVLAEALLCKLLGWDIEFLSAGYSYEHNDLISVTKSVYEVYKKKQWLNVGVLSKNRLQDLKPYLTGICGAIECINPEIHKIVCPSKPIEPYVKMFKEANKLGLKNAMTIILGLGETKEDIKLLHNFIKENNIERITFYALKPIKGTLHKTSPDFKYFQKWIVATRLEFPKIEIIASTFYDLKNEILLMKSGINGITKFQAIKLFNSKKAQTIENAAKSANRRFIGTLTKIPEINMDKELSKLNLDKNLNERIKLKLTQYLIMLKKEKDYEKEVSYNNITIVN